MKKIFLLSTLFAILTFAGCSGNVTTQNSQQQTTSENTSTSIENTINYSISVVLPNGEALKNSSTMVQICEGELCYMPIALGNEGTLIDNRAPGNYEVHLLRVPEQYTYNPNIYLLTEDITSVVIQLVDIKTPVSGEGSLSENGRYVVEEGTYNVTIANSNEIKYFGFTPSKVGTYIFETWSSDSNTIFYNHGIDKSNILTSYSEMIKEGGKKKNFKYTWNVTSNEVVSASITFGISIAESRTTTIPLNITYSN